MRKGGRRSSNVEDRRGQRGGGGGFRLPGGMRGGRRSVGGGGFGKGKGGILGIIILMAIAYFTGANPLSVLMGGGGGGIGNALNDRLSSPPAAANNDELSQFVGVVLADTEDTWGEIYTSNGWGQYPEPKLILFSGSTRSACGQGKAAMGPFYCPADQQVYIDLSFYQDLRQRYKAPGDFAQAYVIAHEVGHHLQTVMGISGKVQQRKQRMSEAAANVESVKLELQADCFAGIWAHHANRRGVLEQGDVEEALTAAAAIGDDQLQRQATGTIQPESFTHGTSEQRQRWFMTGLRQGSIQACDTFSVRRL